MACTMKHPNGQADVTGVTPTGTASYLVYGPPPSGNPNRKGVFICQSTPGTSGTYRFLEEVWTPGVASPSTWVFA